MTEWWECARKIVSLGENSLKQIVDEWRTTLPDDADLKHTSNGKREVKVR